MKNKYIIFRKAQKSRMQMFEEPQFGQPCYSLYFGSHG